MMVQNIFTTALFLGIAFAESNLCIQGCCDQKLDLPSTQLKLVPAANSKASAESITLGAAELNCCPCPTLDEAKTVPINRFDEIICAEDTCFPWCECPRKGHRDLSKPQLRPLCPVDECNPKKCLCRAELLQGFHDLFFGDGDKDGQKTVKSWNAFADMLGIGKMGQKEQKEEQKKEL